MSTSSGGGYCDCGDEEAWRCDAFCEVHAKGEPADGRKTDGLLDPDLVSSCVWSAYWSSVIINAALFLLSSRLMYAECSFFLIISLSELSSKKLVSLCIIYC